MSKQTKRRLLQVGIVCAASLSWCAHGVRAEFGRNLLQRTESLFSLMPHWQNAAPRALNLNGARLIVASGTSEQPMEVLLDHFQANCRAQNAGLHEAAKRVFAVDGKELPSLADGVMRLEQDGVGLVACLGLGDQLTHASVAERLSAFAEDLDLQAWGGVRLVRVQKAGDRSFFVAVWSDGPVPLLAMFPEHGDSPGHALPASFERPEGARRILSVFQEDAGNGLELYERKLDVQTAFLHYAQTLEQAGWRIHDAGALASQPLHAALFLRGASSMVVHAEQRDGTSILSLLNLGE